MRPYDRITYFENKRRICVLEDFKGVLSNYLRGIQYDDDAEIIDTEHTLQVRSTINRNIDSVHDAILAAKINPTVLFKPPGYGASPYHIDVLINVLSLSQHHITYQPVFDHIDRAIGIYQGDTRRSIFRTINPVYWVARLLGGIVELPFMFLGFLGFDKSKAEASALGRVVKGILYLITVLAAFLKILQLLGYLDAFKRLIGI